MSAAEAASYAGVSVGTLRRWVREQRLAAGRTSPTGSGRLVIRRRDLDRLLGLQGEE